MDAAAAPPSMTLRKGVLAVVASQRLSRALSSSDVLRSKREETTADSDPNAAGGSAKTV